MSTPLRADDPRTPVRIQVDPAACRWLARHEPAPDVAYQPGVDVTGQPVVPADVDGGAALALPRQIEIGITVDLAERFGIPRSALFSGEAYAGTVTAEGNRVFFNGRPVTPEAEADLVALCRRQGQNR